MPAIPIGGHFYRAPSLPIAATECINLYAFIPQATTPTKKALLPPAGIAEATTAGSSVTNRGAHVFKDDPYFVQGNDLYRVDQSIDGSGNVTYSSTRVNGGTSITGTQRVMMADNGNDGDQMVIIDPTSSSQFNAWIYDGTNLTAISDTDFDGPVSSVRYVDGYFLFTKKDSQRFFISELRDGTSYIATDFASAEASPDPLVGSFILNNEPVLFGSGTMQTFQNQGGSGFPFASVQGSIQNKGLSARHAVAEVNDLMIWLGGAVGETPSIWVTGGGRPEKLSTVPIDDEIADYTDSTIASCFTWKYSEAGAQFVAFVFPGQRCFVYDFTAGEWHTRVSQDGSGTEIPCRIASAVEAFGEVLVGDSISTSIGVLDRSIYDEYGQNDLPRRFVTPHIDNEGLPFFVDAVELVCETGVGLSSGQGSDPLVSMSWSTNGGRTFTDPTERKVGIGEIGEYDRRVIWNALGRVPRQVCFKFELSDPVKWAIQKVEAHFE